MQASAPILSRLTPVLAEESSGRSDFRARRWYYNLCKTTLANADINTAHALPNLKLEPTIASELHYFLERHESLFRFTEVH